MELELEANMQLDDFYKLSDRAPKTGDEFIYKLVIYYYDADNLVIDDRVKLRTFQRFYKTFDDAVNYIHMVGNETLDTYCYKVFQIPFDCFSYSHGAVWLFDKNGICVDYCLTFSLELDKRYLEETKFYGRDVNRQRFQKGDIVEVMCGDEVYFGVYYGHPFTPGECFRSYERVKQKGWRYPYDDSDEACTILFGEHYRSHSHISPASLMPLSFELPEKTINNMKTWVEKVEQENGVD